MLARTDGLRVARRKLRNPVADVTENFKIQELTKEDY